MAQESRGDGDGAVASLGFRDELNNIQEPLPWGEGVGDDLVYKIAQRISGCGGTVLEILIAQAVKTSGPGAPGSTEVLVEPFNTQRWVVFS